MATTVRCPNVKRLAQILCIFTVGLVTGYGLLRHNITRLGHPETDKPRFKCTEIGPDVVEEFDGSLGMVGERHVPDPSFDVSADIMRVRTLDGSWKPDWPSVRMPSDVELLRPGLVTNVVHYVWCERKIFEFQHYLSVLSVTRMINPQRIVFHYNHYPRYDTQFYNTWFEDMKKEIPYIELAEIGNQSKACASTERQKDFITGLLQKQGGIYVHFNTIFFNFPIKYRKDIMTDALSSGMEGFLVIKKGVRYSNDSSQKVNKLVCSPANEYSKITVPLEDYVKRNPITCAIKKGPYFPRDAWNKSDIFSKTVNVLLYDNSKRPEPVPSNTSDIPNIGHIVWIGGGEMNYLFYLNCLSQLYILKVDALYIHGDMEPSGKYWGLIKQENNVIFVEIVKPNLIFRKNINLVNHMSDMYRVNILARYGGIYSDTDVVWIKPIPHDIRHYDAVASYDWPQMYNVYPDYIQIGVMLGKPGGRFWNFFLHSFKELKDKMYGYNGLLRPYKVFERHPDLLYMFEKLQVMCWNLRCHPTWYPNFRNKNADHRSYPDFNWRDAHAFHWTSPTPEELTSEQALRLSNTIFAEIGRHVLKAAGKL